MSAKSLKLSKIIFLLAGTLFPFPVEDAMCFQNPGNNMEMTASMWDYKSICEFNPPPHSVPQTIIQKLGTLTTSISDCRDLEKKHGHPPAVFFELKNNSSEKIEIIFGGLESVVLTNRQGGRISPIAMWLKMPVSSLGTTEGFFHVVVGNYSFPLLPSEELNLVFLFQNAKAGDIIRLNATAVAAIK